MKQENNLKSSLKLFIKDLKEEIIENKKDRKTMLKDEDFSMVEHLDSVNQCLEYVVDRLALLIRGNK